MPQPRIPELPDHPAYRESYIWYMEKDIKSANVLHRAIEAIADEYERRIKASRERWLVS